jgi:predicted cupin superfamily sugar epimerase
MHPDVPALIAHYALAALPSEGTLFVGTYRSAAECADGGPAGTAMIGLYCNELQSHSLFHRLPVDEVWHFYRGDPLRLVLLYPDGTSCDVIMGDDPLNGERVQFVVPAGTWQAGHCVEDGRYSLFGCTVAPGFTGAMFEGGTRDVLLASHPDRRADIERLACAPAESRMPDGFAR